MKKYKVLTNRFENFTDGDIIIESPFDPEIYVMYKNDVYIRQYELPAIVIREMPDEFEEIK